MPKIFILTNTATISTSSAEAITGNNISHASTQVQLTGQYLCLPVIKKNVTSMRSP